MKRFWKLRLWLASMFDLLWAPIDQSPPDADRYSLLAISHPEIAAHMNEPKLSTREHLAELSYAIDQMFDDLENIKLEQKRVPFSIDNLQSRIDALRVNVISITKHLQHQIHELGGEAGHREHQRDIRIRRIEKSIGLLEKYFETLDRQRDAHSKDIANCMKLIKHQHQLIGSFKVTCNNRRSLMRLLVEVRVRRSDFVQVVDSTFEMSKKKKSDLRVRFRREYRSLEHMVLVQFPECANTWPFEDPPRGRSVCWLRNRMRKIDQDLAWAVGLTNHEYRSFLHSVVLQAIAKENNP